jgi:hypothetical protein
MTTIKMGAGVLSLSVQGHFAKQAFHKDGRSLLKKLAAELGLSKDDYSIRSNLGGDAVVGEVILQTDTLYVQLMHDGFQGPKMMFRSCNGRKDYTGGRNQWADPTDLMYEDRSGNVLRNLRTTAAIEQESFA